MSAPSPFPHTCPRCGDALSATTAEGLCPRCLMSQALQPEEAAEASAAAAAGDSTVLSSAVYSEATIPLANPRPTTRGADAVDLPLPEELTEMLPRGNYMVESFLGQGGMGAVYKGTQIRLKRRVAIKIMRRDQGKDHDFALRFEREAQAMATLNHPNIVSVIDYGEAGPDYLYIVMELVDGADLMEVIRTGGMTQEMALSLLPQVCDALQFAHDHGIVHRDIKPSNIMLTRDGRVKMADFGLAKRYDAESSFRTQTGTGMGTPDYAAPEQFDPTSTIDHRADIYALGVMIYQMITGQLPRGVWRPPSQRAEVAPQWDSIVSRAMQSDPADRYQRASEVKTDVSSIPLAAAAPAAEVETTPSRRGKAAATASTRRRPPLLIGLMAGAMVLVLGAFLALRQNAAAPSKVAAGPPAAPGAGRPTTPAEWRPAFTPQEWSASIEGRQEFADGLMHLTKFGRSRSFPWADGAIRARIRLKPGTALPSVYAREGDKARRYKLFLESSQEVCLDAVADSGRTFERLGTHRLARPLAPDSMVVLELRANGDQLQGLVNDEVLIHVRDARYSDPGRWGINADEGWYESVEVRSGEGAAARTGSRGLWTDALAKWWEGGGDRAGWERRQDGSALSVGSLPSIMHHGFQYAQGLVVPESGDQGVRATFRLGSSPYVQLIVRRLMVGKDASGYKATLGANPTIIKIADDVAGSEADVALAEVRLPQGFDSAASHTLEFRAEGQVLTLVLDGATLYQKTHSLRPSGYPVLCAREGAVVEKFEVADLDGAVEK